MEATLKFKNRIKLSKQLSFKKRVTITVKINILKDVNINIAPSNAHICSKRDVNVQLDKIKNIKVTLSK